MTSLRQVRLFSRATLLLAVCLAAPLGSSCTLELARKEPVHVIFWHTVGETARDLLKAKVDAFNQLHPDIHVDARWCEGGTDRFGPQLDGALAVQSPPDLVWWAPAFFPKYVEMGVLRSLDDLIAQDPEFDRHDVHDVFWELGSFDGRIYATPFAANNLAVYYDKQLFAEAGIARPPETWEEFRAAARKFTAPEVRGFEIPLGTSEWTVWNWECLLWQAGGEILAPDKRSAAFNSPAGVAALDLWKSLIGDGSALFSEPNAGSKIDNIVTGRVAMTINGPWSYGELRVRAGARVGVFPLPRRDRAATNIGGESLFLLKSTPEKEQAAWRFMRYVMGPDFQVDWAIETGYIPVSKSATADPRYQVFLRENPMMQIYTDQMVVGKARPSIPQYPEMSAILGRYLQAALQDKLTSKEALDQAAVEVNRLFQPS